MIHFPIISLKIIYWKEKKNTALQILHYALL